jgi:hypothetical protein
LTVIVLRGRELVSGISDELVGLLYLKTIGEGFDEGGDEDFIDVGLGLGGDQFVICEAVILLELEDLTGVLQIQLGTCEEAEVLFENF